MSATDDFKTRALRVINIAFGGVHHVNKITWGRDQCNPHRCSFTVHEGSFASYDYNEMTKLVVASHDECVRADVGNGGPRRLKIILSNRERTSAHPDVCAHPTLEKHVEAIRRGGSMQWLFDEMRSEAAQ